MSNTEAITKKTDWKFGSVCSGIEAASVAWHPLGWKAAWLSEIEPFPSAVLAHHYPDVPNLGDMTTLPDRITSGEVEAPDLFCGGTPCQAFSVAGLRKSLDDARGNLSLTFCNIANAIDTTRHLRGEQLAIIFWENVPGVLSTKDNAFGCFLAGLAGEDDPLQPPGGKWQNAGCVFGPTRAVAWRVLDAQYFGVAQRRRRVFVVASSREGFDPAAVLFEWDSLRRDFAPSRETGKVAPTIPSRSTAGGGLGTDFDLDGGVIQHAQCKHCAAFFSKFRCAAQSHGECDCPKCQGYCECLAPKDDTVFCIKGAAIGRQPEAGPQHGEVLEDICYTQNCVDQHAVAYPVAGSICAHSFVGGPGGRPEGAAQGHFVPVAFHPTQDPIHSSDGTTHAMGTRSAGGCATVAVAQPIGLDEEQNAMVDAFGTLKARTAGGGFEGTVMQTNMMVRRLTPRECERLQGFPDDYTAIPWRKKTASECPDGPRYKALGNSWAVPVVRWIGERIQKEINKLEQA